MPKGTKVGWGFSAGMTKPSTGKATVYVSGTNKGTFRAPWYFFSHVVI